MEPWIVLTILSVPGAVWFWSHCASPALRFGPPLAARVGLILTALLIAADAVRLALWFLYADSIATNLVWAGVEAAYVVVVLLGWPRYIELTRVCRSIERRGHANRD
jgi:hypothetical protein